MSLHFIGVLHNDPEGYDRTRTALKQLNPRIIGVEWAGEEHEKFLASKEVQDLRANMDQAIRVVFTELGVDSELYDQANRISNQTTYGEVRAVRDFCLENGLVVVPTESAKARIKMDRNYFENVSEACAHYREWLADDRHNPVAVNAFDDNYYDDFEAHLKDQLSYKEVSEWLEQNIWAFSKARVGYQVKAINVAVAGLNQGETFVHVGGLAHLIDDGLSSTHRTPLNLWQHIREKHGKRASRHSLGSFYK